MDELDKKILAELLKDSHKPISLISKKVLASREVVNYRIERLVKTGIIKGFITEIDFEKLGFEMASLSISIKTNREDDFVKFILQCDFTAWSGEFSGIWNFGIGIFGRNNEEINNNFLKIYTKFKEDIIDYRLVIHKKTKHFYEKYLGLKSETQKIVSKKDVLSLDKIDKIILKEISVNSRIDYVYLANKVLLTAPGVVKRVKNLVKKGVIKRYSIFIDPAKINLYQFSVFIKNNNIIDREKLISFLENHLSVSFTVEYVGDPFLEFGVVVKNPYNLRKVLQSIEESFPENRIVEMFLIQKELISISPPKCLFK